MHINAGYFLRNPWAWLYLLILSTYAWTAAPTFTGGDAGVLVVCSWSGGIPHAPGYPLFAMLGRLFAFVVRISNVAWRYNFFSGMCNATAALCVGTLVSAITRDKFSGLFAMILSALSPLLWRYSVVTEVFALNQLIVAVFLWMLWRFLRHPETRRWLMLCLVAGLGASHQHTSILVTAPILLVLLIKERARFFQRIGQALAAGCVGLLPYAYLYIVAQPHLPWITTGDTSTLPALLHHFLRRDYGTFRLSSAATGNLGSPLLRLWFFAKELPLNSFFWRRRGAGCARVFSDMEKF